MCFKKAAEVCQRTYGCHPDLRIEGHQGTSLSYIPVHLEYMLLELLKNAMRSTVEKAQELAAEDGKTRGGTRAEEYIERWPIVATIAATQDLMTVRISDREPCSNAAASSFTHLFTHLCDTGESTPCTLHALTGCIVSLVACAGGGGIEPALEQQIWKYGYSTVPAVQNSVQTQVRFAAF